MYTLLPKIFSVVTLFLALPSASFAAPSVSGNTLTWPDTGWYQVQRSDNYETVCEGVLSEESNVTGGPCVLDPGDYIAIDHTSGERFENIAISSTTNVSDTIMVDRARISWPDNGWYQVQNAITFSTECEGTRSCEVNDGNYVVINHTTGERFTDIRVNSESQADGDHSTVITVNGQLLSWPDDGWYQVQNAETFETQCSGTTSCWVEAGQYIVINHTSGERHENIIVQNTSDDDSQPPTDTQDVISLESYQQILKEAIYYINNSNFTQEFIQPLNLNEPTTEILTEVVFPEIFGEVTNSVRKSTYHCAEEGEKDIYTRADGNPYSGSVSQYNQCTEHDGTSYSGISSSTSNNDLQYMMTRVNSSLNQSASLEYEYVYSNSDRTGNNVRTTYSNLEYLKQDGEQTTIVSNYNQSQSWLRGNVGFNDNINVTTFGYGLGSPGAFIAYHVKNTGGISNSFNLQSPATSNQSVTVDVGISGSSSAINYGGQDLSLEEFLASTDFDTTRSPLPYDTADEPWHWNNGNFSITAEDGSRIILDNFRVEGFDVNLFDAQNNDHTIIQLQWADGYTIPCRSGYCDRVNIE